VPLVVVVFAAGEVTNVTHAANISGPLKRGILSWWMSR